MCELLEYRTNIKEDAMKSVKITALLLMLGSLAGCYTAAVAGAGAGAGYIYAEEKDK
jgi:hypothetical protein